MIQMYIKKTVFLYETEGAEKMKQTKYGHDLRFTILSLFFKKNTSHNYICG
jgi:hypothetical protein